jgi:hypothetical protein
VDDVRWPHVVGLDDRVAAAGMDLHASATTRHAAVNPNLVRILDADLGLLPHPRPHGIDETRQMFVDMLNVDGPRRADAWRRAVADLDHPGTLVVSVCNAAFLPFLERWLSSCDERSIEVRSRTVIVALDPETDRRCRQLGLTVVTANGEDRDDLASVVGWNDTRFSRLVPWKSVATWDALHLAPTVLFQDVDVLWLRDPVADLAGRERDADVLIMHDGPNPSFAPLHGNSGFVQVRAGDATRSLWETVVGNAASIVHLGTEQLVLNRVLERFHAHNLVRVQVLPESEYLNGHLFDLVDGLSPTARRWRSEGVVIHYSWTRDPAEKLAKVERFGLA